MRWPVDTVAWAISRGVCGTRPQRLDAAKALIQALPHDRKTVWVIPFFDED
ncbi:MAG: hypothetical protein ACK5MY_02070 [Jhaorihella sp.]